MKHKFSLAVLLAFAVITPTNARADYMAVPLAAAKAAFDVIKKAGADNCALSHPP